MPFLTNRYIIKEKLRFTGFKNYFARWEKTTRTLYINHRIKAILMFIRDELSPFQN